MSYICTIINYLILFIMKKMFLFMFVLVSVFANAQCYQKSEPVAHFSMSYGVKNSGSADLALSANNVRLGIGATALVDENTYNETIDGIDYKYKRFESGVYGIVGYQFKEIVFGAIIGNKFINPNEYYNSPKLPKENELLYGGFLGYRITQILALNVGYNTLSNINFGLSVGI